MLSHLVPMLKGCYFQFNPFHMGVCDKPYMSKGHGPFHHTNSVPMDSPKADANVDARVESTQSS